MALPTSGPISMSAINTELNYIPWNGNIWMSHQWLRDLSGQQGNPMYMSNFRGKAKVVATPLKAYFADYEYYDNIQPSVAFTATAYVNAQVTGGTAPYTYSWTRLSGMVSLTNTTSQQVIAKQAVARFGGYYHSQVRLTVTDATGATSSHDGMMIWEYGNI